MKKIIAILPGDGIGPEIIEQSVNILKRIAEKHHHEFIFEHGYIGGAAIKNTGETLPNETLELTEKADAILFGAIGDPDYDNDPTLKVMRPEQSLIAIRKKLGLYINMRPILSFPSLFYKSPLKADRLEGVDFVVVRELIGGLYYGERGRKDNGKTAFDTCVYSQAEILRITKFAFDLAKRRKKKVTLIDKANVLETSRLWRETVTSYAQKFPEITLEMMYVDNASMQLIKRPNEFDVILAENMFGDILSDEASVITGSIGMLPSASIGEKTSLYEPIHGSFPKAAGKNTANPIGSILSTAMMLSMSFGLEKESQEIYQAVKKVIDEGYGTADITDQHIISTSKLGEKIIENL